MTGKKFDYATIRVEAFDRKTEFIAMELKIAPIPLLELRRLADLPEDIDSAVGGIDLKSEHLPKIREWINMVLDSDRYDIQFSEGALSPSFKD